MSGAVSGADGNRIRPRSAPTSVRGHDFVRYASTLFTPQISVAGLLALYAFNVELAGFATRSASHCPAKSGCNGGPTAGGAKAGTRSRTMAAPRQSGRGRVAAGDRCGFACQSSRCRA